MIEQNLKQVRSNIEVAVKKSGRKLEDVTLIAVSKTKPIEDLIEAANCGVINFGENKTGEIVSKYEHFENCDVNFHMIGHLQRNKVKYIVDKVVLIHSLDSVRLARKIDEQANKKGVVVDVLVQINIGDEQSKFGIKASDIDDFMKDISIFENIRVRGLMCIAPYVEDAEQNRHLFKQMNNIFIDIKDKNKDNNCIDILSMGMSNDYQVAIEEGATMVRVGTAIFGRRNYIKA